MTSICLQKRALFAFSFGFWITKSFVVSCFCGKEQFSFFYTINAFELWSIAIKLDFGSATMLNKFARTSADARICCCCRVIFISKGFWFVYLNYTVILRLPKGSIDWDWWIQFHCLVLHINVAIGNQPIQTFWKGYFIYSAMNKLQCIAQAHNVYFIA